MTQVSYHDDFGRTMGELDLVIWNTETEEAEALYEAKVSNNLPGILRTATRQMNRFQVGIRDDTIARITYSRDPSRRLRTSHFQNIRKISFIGSKGALEAGFDMEIDLTREEVDYLMRRVLAYRKAGLFEVH